MTNSLTVLNRIIVESKLHNKPILCDARFMPGNSPKPTVLFVHGFKGFKDWGHWNLIADAFAAQGFCFVKMNLSHNGTTVENPTDFADLEAFSENTLSIELADVATVIDHMHSSACTIPNMDLSNLFLIGHSRGGGIVLINAKEDKRVKGVVTWASVSDYKDRWPNDVLEKWEQEGVHHIYNGRTKQNMPMKYTIVEDFYAHEDRLTISKSVEKLSKPALFIHGTEDPTVDVSAAHDMHDWNKKSELYIIDGADHVFNGKHPYHEKELPGNSQQLVDKTLSFLQKISV